MVELLIQKLCFVVGVDGISFLLADELVFEDRGFLVRVGGPLMSIPLSVV